MYPPHRHTKHLSSHNRTPPSSSCPKSGIPIYENRSGISSAPPFSSSSLSSSNSSSYTPRVKVLPSITSPHPLPLPEQHRGGGHGGHGSGSGGGPKDLIVSHSTNTNNSIQGWSGCLTTPITANTRVTDLDLNIEHYGLHDLYQLFQIPINPSTGLSITREKLTQAKIMMSKVHPDKSHIDPKYFLFYQKAYQRLCAMAEYLQQQQPPVSSSSSSSSSSRSAKYSPDDIHVHGLGQETPEQHQQLMKQTFGGFGGRAFQSNEFNSMFESHFREEEPGYDSWMNSSESSSFFGDTSNVRLSEFNSVLAQQRKRIAASSASKPKSGAGSSIFGNDDDDDTDAFSSSSSVAAAYFGTPESYSGNTSSGLVFTDLKEAHGAKSICDIDVDAALAAQPKYLNVEEYKRARDGQHTTPPSLSKDEQDKYWESKRALEEQKAATIAYQQIQQSDKLQQKNQSFWSKLLSITAS